MQYTGSILPYFFSWKGHVYSWQCCKFLLCRLWQSARGVGISVVLLSVSLQISANLCFFFPIFHSMKAIEKKPVRFRCNKQALLRCI